MPTVDLDALVPWQFDLRLAGRTFGLLPPGASAVAKLAAIEARVESGADMAEVERELRTVFGQLAGGRDSGALAQVTYDQLLAALGALDAYHTDWLLRRQRQAVEAATGGPPAEAPEPFTRAARAPRAARGPRRATRTGGLDLLRPFLEGAPPAGSGSAPSGSAPNP